MKWSDEKQTRFDELRHRDLIGTISDAEQHELEALTNMLTKAADEALLPANERLQRELTELETRLKERQDENEELAKLLHQQEQLTAETRQWLHDFDRRHAQIREKYTRLTGEVLMPG